MPITGSGGIGNKQIQSVSGLIGVTEELGTIIFTSLFTDSLVLSLGNKALYIGHWFRAYAVSCTIVIPLLRTFYQNPNWIFRRPCYLSLRLDATRYYGKTSEFHWHKPIAMIWGFVFAFCCEMSCWVWSSLCGVPWRWIRHSISPWCVFIEYCKQRRQITLQNKYLSQEDHFSSSLRKGSG